MLSIAEENYIKAIFKIAEKSGVPVATNAIAEAMRTSPASVSDMVKKLAEKELLHYEKYKGVLLSNAGKKEATFLIRKHRLWESFLVNKLGYKWDEIHEIAEQLEHVKSDNLIDKLEAFLDFPKFDPHGDPIPDKQGKFTIRKQSLLYSTESGLVIVIGVLKHESAFLKFLNQIDIQLGQVIEVVEHLEYDDSIKIKVGNETFVISGDISKNILVKAI